MLSHTWKRDVLVCALNVARPVKIFDECVSALHPIRMCYYSFRCLKCKEFTDGIHEGRSEPSNSNAIQIGIYMQGKWIQLGANREKKIKVTHHSLRLRMLKTLPEDLWFLYTKEGFSNRDVGQTDFNCFLKLSQTEWPQDTLEQCRSIMIQSSRLTHTHLQRVQYLTAPNSNS